MCGGGGWVEFAPQARWGYCISSFVEICYYEVLTFALVLGVKRPS